MIKKINLVIIIFGLLFITSYVSAGSCTLNVSTPVNQNLTTSPLNINQSGNCDSGSCYFTLVQNGNQGSPIVVYDSGIIFSNSGCGTNKIVLKLTSDLNVTLTKNKSINYVSISGVDSISLNGFKMNFNINNPDTTIQTTISILSDIVSNANGSEINVIGPTRNSYVTNSSTVVFDFNNINVTSSGSLNLNLIGNKPSYAYEYISGANYDTSISGTNMDLEGNNILNNGTLNINIKGGDSLEGYDASVYANCHSTIGVNLPVNGGNATAGGYSKLILNKLENNSNLNIDVNSGNGGNGGKGCNRGYSDWPSVKLQSLPPGNGGNGGDSGLVTYYVKNINNYNNANLSVLLNSGNAGNGEDTGWDSGKQPNSAIVGNGGNTGDIVLCNSSNYDNCTLNNSIKQLTNKGYLNLQTIFGNAGNGGNKRNHADYCTLGNGGNGGDVSDLIINYLNNSSNNFNLNIISGDKGLKGNCVSSNPSVDGNYGTTKNIKINNLYNKANGIDVNLTTYKQTVPLNTSDIIINNLQSDSYLPNSLKTLNNAGNIVVDQTCKDNCYSTYNCTQQTDPDCNSDYEVCPSYTVCSNQDAYNSCVIDCSTGKYNTTNRAINVNSCYVNRPLNKLNYITGNLNINATNNSDLQNIIDPTNVYSNNYQYRYCPYCDVIPLNNTIYRIPNNYNLYSDLNGSIDVGDLNIYYMTQKKPISIFNLIDPLDSTKNIPLYKNNKPITGVYNNKVGLYEYKIDKSILDYYWSLYDPNIVLDNSGNNLFCAAQNYKISGKITRPDGSTNYFSFKFLPVFKMW